MTHAHRGRFPRSHRHSPAPAGAPGPGTASCRAQAARPTPDERAASPWTQAGATTDASTRLSIRQSFPGEWVVDLLQALANRVDVTSLCRKTVIAYDRPHDAPHRVPCDEVLQMLEDAADLSGDPLIGMHLAEEMEPRSVPVYLARTQRTVREALRQLCRFQHLLWLGLPLIVVERGSSQLLITLPSDLHRESRHLTELFLASLFLEAQRMLGQPLHIEEVRLRHQRRRSPDGVRTSLRRAGPLRSDGGRAVLSRRRLRLPRADLQPKHRRVHRKSGTRAGAAPRASLLSREGPVGHPLGAAVAPELRAPADRLRPRRQLRNDAASSVRGARRLCRGQGVGAARAGCAAVGGSGAEPRRGGGALRIPRRFRVQRRLHALDRPVPRRVPQGNRSRLIPVAGLCTESLS